MTRPALILLFLLSALSGLAQQVKVPNRIEFAGMKLRLTSSAQEEVQGYVDALTQHPRYFQQKVDLMDIYYPLVEKALKEEGVPTDLKYLMAQESSFIADAVSSSNAVGYWQFKDFTGREMGLRIDGYIDERMHVMASSRGAAKYLKRHNFHFQNWVHAVIAYHQGLVGAQKRVDERENGANRMTIDKNTFWYFKKFLAHKLAFEEAIGKNKKPALRLEEYDKTAGKSLKQVAKELDVDFEDLKAYNKWLRRGRIPSEKNYVVIVPIRDGSTPPPVVKDREAPVMLVSRNHKSSKEYYKKLDKSLKDASKKTSEVSLINGIPAVIATGKDNIESLAELGDISERRFRRYNDLSRRSTVKKGQIYYFKKKRRKARVHYHTVREGETLWEISQLYGLRLKHLRRKNRMRRKESQLSVGRILWMRFIRPSNHPIEFIPEKERQLASFKDSLPSLPMIDEPTAVEAALVVQNASAMQEKLNTEESEQEVASEEEEIEPIEPSPKPEVIKEEKPQEEAVPVEVEESGGWDDSVPEHLQNGEGDIADPQEKIEEENARELARREKTREQNELKKANGPVRNHTVVKGDTYYGISRKYDVSINDLLAWNNLTIDQPLALGAVLSIGGQQEEKKVEAFVKPKPSTGELHIVKAGETLYSISREYGVTVKELMEWNDKENFEVQVDEELKISE